MKVATATDKDLMVRLDIFLDEDAEDPRGWDNAGKMVCWHNRYDLGDRHGFRDPDEFEEFWQEAPAGGVRLPLYLMDHSGLAMSTGDLGDPWDSGQVGWIYVSATDLIKEWSDRDDKTAAEWATECLKGEVKTYSQYLAGEVYGFNLVSIEPNGDDGFGAYAGDGDSIDSCWGFYGYDYAKSGMTDHVDPKYAHLFTEAS